MATPSAAHSIRVRQEDDEQVFELSVGGEVVCTVRTCAHRLVKIITVSELRGKGYGTKLLQHVEEEERQNGARIFDTTDINSTDNAVVSFFKKNGYTNREKNCEEVHPVSMRIGKNLG
jgi:GNAT superfamily N-acetyltransferase